MNGTHQHLVYADDVDMLVGSVHIVKENAAALTVTIKETGLEVRGNADKTKYMVMSRDKNAGRRHNMKIDNRSFERVEKFKYLETTLTLRRLMYIYIYGAPILDVSRSHTTTQHSR